MKIKKIERQNPQNREESPKTYGQAVVKGVKTQRAIAQDIADISSLSRGDTGNVLDNLVLQIPKYLSDGMSVKLDGFGSFRLSISTEGTETPEEFNANKVKNARIIFTPGQELKKALTELKFEVE
ncbi:DNA-binding protein [Marinilabiliaceae bacterium JC017]|nr:DNA-binding protein [Marinilabiliaceae bacterium JC017]